MRSLALHQPFFLLNFSKFSKHEGKSLKSTFISPHGFFFKVCVQICLVKTLIPQPIQG